MRVRNMTLDEITISRAIISDHLNTLLEFMEMKVTVFGGHRMGPVFGGMLLR